MARLPGETLEDLGGRKKLSATELEFMKYIWSCPEGVSSEAIYNHFPHARGTKSTILYNISEKQYVDKVQKGLHHYYTAQITEAEYNRALIRQQLRSAFGDSSFERLVAVFCGKAELTPEEKTQARKFWEELGIDEKD